MPIFSYLAMPKTGSREQLCRELSDLEYCQVIQADNRDIVVLVTDTPDDNTEKHLQKTLQKLHSLQSLSLTFGYDEKD